MEWWPTQHFRQQPENEAKRQITNKLHINMFDPVISKKRGKIAEHPCSLIEQI